MKKYLLPLTLLLFAANLLFGSVAAKIVQKAACPVLVIPMPDKG